MKDLTFFVYCYTFEDGKKYIGRSRSTVRRFNNPDAYKTQYVGRMMAEQKYTAEKIYESKNPIKVYRLEKELIETYWDNLYNASKEEDWLYILYKDLGSDSVDCGLSDFKKLIEDYETDEEFQGIIRKLREKKTIGKTKN